MWEQRRFGPSGGLFGIVELPCPGHFPSPLVLFLPGLGQSSTEKNYLFTRLRHLLATKGCTCVQFDYYGHGDSDGDLSDVTLSSMVSDTVHVMSAMLSLHTPPTVILIGNGLGSAIAIKAAHNLNKEIPPEQVQHILINPPLQPIYKVFHKVDLQKFKRSARGGSIPCTKLIPGNNYYTYRDFPSDRLDYFLQLGSQITNLHGQSVSMQLLQELEQLNSLQLLQNTPIPVHIILGDKHPHLQTVKHIPTARLYALSNVQYFFQSPHAHDELLMKVIEIVGTNHYPIGR